MDNTVDEFNGDDAESFAYYYTHLGEDQVEYYEKALRRDYRKHVVKGDVTERYYNYNKWRSTSFAKDCTRTVELLPDDGRLVSVKDLRNAMTNSFAMSKDYANKVIKEIGSNDTRINARNHSYDKSIDEIRLKKIK